MEVGPPTHDDYLGIAWIAQVCRQLPLSGAVPAHVEEDLDDDEYDDNSDEEKQNKKWGAEHNGHALDFYQPGALTCTSTAPFPWILYSPSPGSHS